MSTPRIERSCDRDRGYTEAEIRDFIAHTKRMQAAPGYAAREAKRVAEAERRAKGKGIRFPELAQRRSTKPAVVKKSSITGQDEILLYHIL
jgi:hypothetical protein